MTSSELRQKFLNFFEKNGHKIVPSAKIVPENDPTTLFITAGMQPLVPFLLGESHPEGKRLVDAQKCLRTDDIDEVGDSVHHTFFEMLGNWSLGDYFKDQSIRWSFEFLTSPEWLNIPIEKLAISVFAGDEDAPFDEDSFRIWQELGIPEARIAKLGKKDNWWGPAGQTGPCGPDTEIFYWASNESAPENFESSDSRWVEIWNNVFMQFNKTPEGKFEHLTQQNVDTGMGLERTLAVLQGLDDNYLTDLFFPIIEKMSEYLEADYNDHKTEFRVVADHIKAATFLIKDGILPSNKLQGYILRRLLRRAAVKLNFIKEGSMDLLPKLVDPVLDIYSQTNYFQTGDWNEIRPVVEEEINKFQKTLKQGLKEIGKVEKIDGVTAFNLYQSYGFPIEITAEIAKEKGQEVNMEEFQAEIDKHRQLSQTTSAGIFKGGLADHTEQTTKLHTATHLLQAAAKQVLGQEVGQRGSNITAERLRWDFNYPQKASDEQLHQIEDLVNQKIQEDLKVWFDIEDRDQAISEGATTNFGENYPDKVKVYKMSSSPENPEAPDFFSKELCGGPHVDHTSTLNHFKITKEESVSAGIRRIYATVE
jgi:alanyl-tRNA synthetase